MRLFFALAIALFTTLLSGCFAFADEPSKKDAVRRVEEHVAKKYSSIRNMWGEKLSPLTPKITSLTVTGELNSRNHKKYTYSYVAEIVFDKEVFLNTLDHQPRACEDKQVRSRACVLVKKGDTLRLPGKLNYGKSDSGWEFNE